MIADCWRLCQNSIVNPKRLLRVFVVVFFACALLGQGKTEQWRTYKNELGNFSILLPSEPKDETTQKTDQIEAHAVHVLQGGVSYLVLFMKTASENPVDEASFNDYKAAIFKSFENCNVQK